MLTPVDDEAFCPDYPATVHLCDPIMGESKSKRRHDKTAKPLPYRRLVLTIWHLGQLAFLRSVRVEPIRR